jgi:predicted nuclease with TOPRIM domain
MPKTQRGLRKRLEEVEVKIQETQDRLPAHSVKPPIMMELLELEDEAHALRQRLETMRGEAP